MKPLPRSWAPALFALAASAPVGAGEPADPEQTVVVTGVRESLQSAQARKEAAPGLLDAVLAAEIGKLPELSVSDAVQRATGVQIVRDRGEGSVVAVRGLVQVETTLNGREVFTAGSGRTLDFADVAAESVAGIDVHKSASAERIEGGVGGSIDLRTRHPFDFDGAITLLSLRVLHGDPVDRSAGQGSLLLVRRFGLGGGGEVGALVNLVLQNRAWREDQKSAGNPVVRSDLVPGVDVVAPNGTSETVSTGTRRRSAASVLLHWRQPGAGELYAEAHLAELRTRQDSQQINVSAGTGFAADSVTLFPGTTDLRSITWTDAPFSILSFARDTVDRTRQFAFGGRTMLPPATLAGDLSYTDSVNRLFFSGPFFGGRVARFSQDLSTVAPGTAVAGTDLLDPANLAYTGLAYRVRPFAGNLLAARLDATWPGPVAAIERVQLGWRYARRRADDAPGLVFGDVPISGLGAADTPDRVMPMPYGPLLDGRVASIRPFLVGRLDGARDAASYRQSFGITQPLPEAGNPLGVWQAHEQTQALYALARGSVAEPALEGELGLRVVQTRLAVDGSQTEGGGIAPIAVDSRYTDLLPSLNLRHRIGPGLLLRAAASRAITRADFDQLSPSLTLVPNPVNPALNQGSAGNPALRPVHSTAFDLALEGRPAAGSSASLTLFCKRVEGFIASFSQPEQHDGATYQVSRPYNSQPADVRGAELAYQGFFSSLPGAWRGLGLQANYTFVDSRTPDSRLQAEVPLQNLSRHSGNLIGLYELGPWSARLAWNWRSSFLSGVSSFVGVGALAAYTHGYGWFDASLGWRVDRRVTLALEGGNLSNTLRRSYYGVTTRPQNAISNDRQLGLRVTAEI